MYKYGTTIQQNIIKSFDLHLAKIMPKLHHTIQIHAHIYIRYYTYDQQHK